MKWVFFFGLTAAAAGVASWQIFSVAARGRQEDPDSSGSVVTPTHSQSLAIQGIGYVEPASEVRKLMMRTGGVIKRCCFQVGDTIPKGEIILELDDSTQKADLEVARKQLELVGAEADEVNVGINPYRIKAVEQTVERLREKHRFYQSELDRYGRLRRSNSASQQEYDQAGTQQRQSEVELREQEAELKYLRCFVIPERKLYLNAKIKHAQSGLLAAEERVRETKLLAPFNGTLLKLLKREGEGVRMFEPEAVALFGDVARLRVRAEIDERFVRRLAAGQEAVIYGRNLEGKEYRGKIAYREGIMGDKTVFTRTSSERKDLDVLQVVIEMEPEFSAPVGLQVDVRVQ